MIRKFECKKCHTHFEADDQMMVTCPNCLSDNVDYASNFSMKKAMKWGGGLLVVICLAVIGGFLFNRCNNSGGKDLPLPPEPSDTLIIGGDTIDIEIPDEIKEPPKITSGSLKWVDDGYSFNVKIEHAPSSPYYIALVEHRGTKEIVRSEDGKTFKNVPPSSEEEGKYDIVVFDEATKERLTTIEKPGFTPPVTQRMSKEQLQTLIDKDDESLYGINKQIAEGCKLTFTGLPADAKKPETMADVMMKIGMMWSSVQVIGVQYDNENRISAITFHVKMAE